MSTRRLITLPSNDEIREEVLKIARKKLKNLVVDVLAEDDVDLDGTACLRITIVLKSKAALLSRGEQLGEISLAIVDFLRERSDPRFPYTHYASRADLAEAASGE
jgi:hypothetical protein